jgi:RTA1 like protein
MGTTWEFASFLIRALGTKNQQNTAFATISQILVLLAPMWINAFDYMLLGRMVYFFVPEQQIWKIKGIKIAKIFVWLDILSFLTQLGGGVLITPGNSASTQMMGIHLYMGGIGLQQFCILVFTSIAIKFHLVMKQRERAHLILDGKPRNWRMLHYVLYASLALISTRIIFRLIEFASGLDPSKNPIPYHEAYFMCLDALPMFIAIALMNIVHPGRVLQGEGSEFPKGPTRKEKKAAKKAKKEAKRAAKEEKRALKEERKMKLKMGSDIEMV